MCNSWQALARGFNFKSGLTAAKIQSLRRAEREVTHVPHPHVPIYPFSSDLLGRARHDRAPTELSVLDFP